MDTFNIPVFWELSSIIEIKANTLTEAIEIANKARKLPTDGKYIDESYQVNTDSAYDINTETND